MKILLRLILLVICLTLIFAPTLYAVSLSEINSVKKSISARYRMLVETTPQYTKDTKTLLWLRTTAPGRLREYDNFFNAALISHSYAIKSLDIALCRLNKQDVEGTRKFIEKSNDYQIESIKHIQSANLALQKGVIKGYENAKWTIEILGASTPWSDQIISGLFLIMDFRMDEALLGENKAERNFYLKLFVTAAFQAIPVKEAFKETALKHPEINEVLTNLFRNPQHREKIIEISARIAKTFSKHITVETIKFILEGAKFAIEYTPSSPSPTSFPQICDGPFPTDPTTVSPQVSMYPPSGPVGTTFTDKGTGFTPNRNATIYGRRPDGSVWTITTVQTDSSGAYSRTWTAQTPGNNFAWWAVDNTTGKKSNERIYSVSSSPTPTPGLTPGFKVAQITGSIMHIDSVRGIITVIGKNPNSGIMRQMSNDGIMTFQVDSNTQYKNVAGIGDLNVGTAVRVQFKFKESNRKNLIVVFVQKLTGPTSSPYPTLQPEPASEKGIDGKWQSIEGKGYLEFFRDGTVLFGGGRDSIAGNYRFVDKNRIRMDFAVPLFGTMADVLEVVSVSETELILKESDGSVLRFRRVRVK